MFWQVARITSHLLLVLSLTNQVVSLVDSLYQSLQMFSLKDDRPISSISRQKCHWGIQKFISGMELIWLTWTFLWGVWGIWHTRMQFVALCPKTQILMNFLFIYSFMKITKITIIISFWSPNLLRIKRCTGSVDLKTHVHGSRWRVKDSNTPPTTPLRKIHFFTRAT